MKQKYNRINAINTDTNEVLGTVIIKADGTEELILDVDKVKQKDAIKKKSNDVKNMSEFIQNNEGSYIHLIYKYGYPIMDKLQSEYEGNKSNIHIIRFVVLATYSTFGGKLFDSNKNRIKRSSLSKIWDVKNNRKSINETYDILTELGYIYETEEGYIMINEDIVAKGAVEDFKKLHKADKDLTYVRVFAQNVQSMYEGTDPKQRKQLANLFKALPFINFKYNVFCTNPTEADHTKLELLNWTDLANLCGYESKANITKFRRDLMKLKIFGYDTIGQFESGSGKAICINPKVYYGGNNIEDVKKIYTMFEMCEGRKYQ